MEMYWLTCVLHVGRYCFTGLGSFSRSLFSYYRLDSRLKLKHPLSPLVENFEHLLISLSLCLFVSTAIGMRSNNALENAKHLKHFPKNSKRHKPEWSWLKTENMSENRFRCLFLTEQFGEFRMSLLKIHFLVM